MTESIKATHALVQIGSITVDGFMLTDGAYRMSLTQAIQFVGATEENFQRFLKSNSPEALVWDGYEVETALDSQWSLQSYPPETCY